MKRLSVIIPMFKVENFVERCLRSLEDQDIPRDSYEIICVNDGSPDNCSGIVRSLQAEFSNIRLIDQENQGVSQARNNGIERASGKYILFIDPDDYVDENSFARILKATEDKNAQVSFLGFTVLEEDGTIRNQVFNEFAGDGILPGIEAYFVSRGDGRTDPDRMWAILFETQFLKTNNLRYLPDVPYLEDGELIARILCFAERCIFCRHSFYQRTTRPGSATNSKLFHLEKATDGFMLAAVNLKRFQQYQNLNERQKEFINQPIVHFVVLVITSGRKPFSFKKNEYLRRKLIESGLSKVKLESVNKTYQKLGYLYNKSFYILLIYQFLAHGLYSLNLRFKKIKL